MFTVLAPWQSHVKVSTVHVMNAEKRQLAADLWTKPNNLGHKSTSRLLMSPSTTANFTIAQHESRYSFTVPRR